MNDKATHHSRTATLIAAFVAVLLGWGVWYLVWLTLAMLVTGVAPWD